MSENQEMYEAADFVQMELPLNDETQPKSSDEEFAEKLSLFREEIRVCINKYSFDQIASTPDWLLAEYITQSLLNNSMFLTARDNFFRSINDQTKDK